VCLVIQIRLNDAAALEELRATLAASDYSTARVDAATLLITHPLSIDEDEARVALAFYLKAWAITHPGVEAELIG
jgi:hypothetical protein